MKKVNEKKIKNHPEDAEYRSKFMQAAYGGLGSINQYGGNSDFWSSGPEVILLYEESISVDIFITLIYFGGQKVLL